ncbi:MAG: hypothetical protein K6T73_11515 [Candidatus Bathyarchaeota archaeon]|nr:hypothetical protein [Candidatus Bathyarchaeota archaeon]
MRQSEALRKSSTALAISAAGYGTDCDPLADVVNYDVIEVLKKVRAGASQRDIEAAVSTLEKSLEYLRRCLEDLRRSPYG